MPRTFSVRTYGCQMNEHDSEHLAGLLEAKGMVPADSEDQADIIVLNTCCIRENADNRLYGALGNLKALKETRPDLQVAVGGCLAQKDKSLIQERAAHVDVVFGTHNIHRAPELLEQALLKGPVLEVFDESLRDEDEIFPSALSSRREIDHRAWVTIQVGCDNACAFCIVPSVRGSEMSRPMEELYSEVKGLVADGVTEITLLGQNVNSYGRDLTKQLRNVSPGPDDIYKAGLKWSLEGNRRARPLFADLLTAVGEIEGIRRVRFTSPHPKDLRTEIIGAMSTTAAVCEHLHLPLQSGSDRVLASMHRGYTAKRYLDKVVEARAGVEDLAVTTDLIVGFPGETEADFVETLEVAAEVGFDSAYSFIFSSRPGTEASEWKDKFVDHDICVNRFERLRKVLEHSALITHRNRVGLIEEVLIEGPAKKGKNLITARTRQNKLVHLRAEENLRIGTFALVRIVDSSAHYLHGELTEIVEVPRHRRRIPVSAG